MKILPPAVLGGAAKDPVAPDHEVASDEVPEVGDVGGTGIEISMAGALKVLVDRDAVYCRRDGGPEGREASAIDHSFDIGGI